MRASRSSARLARRAYRQPVGDAELAPILEFYDAGRARGQLRAGHPARRCSASWPARASSSASSAIRPARRRAASIAVSDLELASRLSFFLWSSIPDDELLTRGGAGHAARSRRCSSSRCAACWPIRASEALVANFAGQWLQLRNVRSVQPNSDEFPDFDDNLRQAFRRETELLFDSIMREDRNVLDLLRADYTFVNERLARHYGIPNVYGSRFRRVPVTDDARRGLLGQGSILAVTSHAERTSPVLRGKWVLENLLGTAGAAAAARRAVAQGATQEGQKPTTLREQMAEHRANPVCASCHKVMDPIGFALENFDAVGRVAHARAGRADRRLGRSWPTARKSTAS